MKNQINDFVNLIDLLEENKKFPYYAAERRIDLFISYYIEQILSDYFNKPVKFVAPEFPIKHDTNNQANKADILCVFPSSKQPVIVEIKTDQTSFKSTQLEKYVHSTQNWHQVIGGLRKIVEKSKSDYRVKYFHLVQNLVKNEVARFSSDNQLLVNEIVKLTDCSSKKEKGERSRKIIRLVKTLEAQWSREAIILYIAPNTTIEKVDEKYKKMDSVHFLRFSDIRIPYPHISESYHRFVSFMHKIA